MSSIKEAPAQRDEVEKILDALALQVMVKGADALTSECLARLIEAADRAGYSDLRDEANSVLTRLDSSSLTEDEAKSIVTRLQSVFPMHEALEEDSKETVADADVPATIDFKDDPEILADFVLESGEHLVAIEEQILLLEKDPTLIDTVHAVFRAFHTIKGIAGFIGLSGVQSVAHEVETLLDHARNLRITITPEFVDLVLDSSEYLKEEVALVRAKLNGAPLPEVRNNTALIRTLSTATANVAAGRSFSSSEGEPSGQTSAVALKPAEATPILPPASSQTLVGQAGTEQQTDLTGPGPAATPQVPKAAPGTPQAVRSEAASTSIRVETSKLDRLMDMVGEMVIAQSILSHIPQLNTQGNARMAGNMSRLARITGEVQRCAMSMRMMPIGPLFQKNAKLVRDLSRRSGKQVSLELAGEATELDKTIAEELSDPLLHMIRNALDHGIEPPEERIAAGKPPVASLRIAAEHQSGQIVISISDDGRGLNPERILSKAVQNGLIEQGAQLAQEDIFQLIFAPGFSTADKITDISGRGVGMDVVRKHVETLRGRIQIKSELGKGTTFLIYLPLTLAIIEGLVVVVGVHHYIIPVFSVREMFRPTQDMLFTVQGRDEMVLMRGELLPLVRLHKRFEIEPRTADICEGLLVVCEFSGRLFCLFVDDLLGRQEVVIKSLDEAFKNIRGITGSAILGDGRIGLILDVAGIFQSTPGSMETVTA
jgi:two-component system, chemotaxis family, sensor kinase CheA